MPYLPAPSRKWWTGNAGSKLCAMPASVPTVSTPKPAIGASSASQRAHSASGPGVWPPLRNASCVAGARVPAGAQQQPAAVGQRAVLGLEGADVVEREQVVGVLGGLGGLVDHHGRADQPGGRDARHVLAVAAGDPVDRRVEVRADVLADLQHVPRPGRPGVVVAAERPPAEPGRVGERLREEQHRRALAQRLGEVDDAHVARGERRRPDLRAGPCRSPLECPRKASSSQSAQMSGSTFASTTSGRSGSSSHAAHALEVV